MTIEPLNGRWVILEPKPESSIPGAQRFVCLVDDEATARRFAASEAMLVALQRLMRQEDGPRWEASEWWDAKEAARVAIAAATGEVKP